MVTTVTSNSGVYCGIPWSTGARLVFVYDLHNQIDPRRRQTEDGDDDSGDCGELIPFRPVEVDVCKVGI